MKKIDLSIEYRKKYGMKMPTLTLARIMYKENIELFKSVDSARSSLRRLEGKVGNAEKKYLSNKDFIMNEERPKNPWKLPESDEAKYEPYILKAKKLAVLSDIHVPYHSISALECALDKIYEEKPDAILLNGDTVDFYGLSR